MAGRDVSVLGALLLLTAAWTHTSRVDATQTLPTTAEGARWWPARETLDVVVTERGYRLRYADDPEVVLAGGDAAARLADVVGALRKHLPSNQPVRVRAADGVAHGRVVQVLDVFLDQGLREVSVGGAG
jgi:biopolymer transport protein ExbD